MEKKNNLAFEKINYILMLIGVLVILLGFIIMATDSSTYGFSFQALTLAPIVILTGFGIQFFAIFYRSKTNNSKEVIEKED